ncbi:MAG: stalk domain-containing protein [Firmicutes bacterium]|nr:stalk domain-containing protein [Bacillota bacterium]
MQKCKHGTRFLVLLLAFALVLGTVPSMPVYGEQSAISTGLSLISDGTIDLAQTGNWSGVSTAAAGITPSVDHFMYTVFPIVTDPPVIEPALRVNNPGFGPPANARGTLTLTSEPGLNWDLGINPRWNRFSLTFMFRTWNLGIMQVVYTFFDEAGGVISTGAAASVQGGQQGWNSSLGGNYQKRSVSFFMPDASGRIIDRVELQFTSSINAEAADPFFVYGLTFDYIRPTIGQLGGVVDLTHFDEWVATTTVAGLTPVAAVNTTDVDEIALMITGHGLDTAGAGLTLTHEGLNWGLQDWNQFHFNFIYPEDGSSVTNFRLTAFDASNQPVFVSTVQDLMTSVNADMPPNYRTQGVVLNFATPAAVVTSVQLEIWFEGHISAMPVYITDMRFVHADFTGEFSFGSYTGWSAAPIGDGAAGSPTAYVPDFPGDRLRITDSGITAGGSNVWRGVRVLSPDGLNLELDPLWNMISFNIFIQDGVHHNIYTELSGFDANGHRVIFDGHRVESSAGNTPADGFRSYAHVFWFEPKISGDVVMDYFHLDIWLNNTALDTSVYVTDFVFNTGVIPSGAGAMSSLLPGVRVGQLNYPNAISIVDHNATPNTRRLLAFMHGIAASDYMLVGMQNPTFINAGGGGQRFTAARFPNRPPTSNHANVAVYGLRNDILYFNDITMVTGEYPAIMGFDTLSFFGFEPAGASNPANRRLGSADLARQWAANGGIVTLSAHMPNFGLLIDDRLINVGPYSDAAEAIAAFGHSSANYGGRNSCTATGGNTMSRILPGGDANLLFRHYLDLVAEFALDLQQDDIPVLFRPFHETNGSWFWWGDAFVSPEGFKNVWRYTVEYLRDYRGVHNLLYVISPNGPFPTEEVFAARYPGNEWVDIIGFDQYLDFPGTSEGFATTVQVVSNFARRNGKVAALTEYGHQPAHNHPHNASEHQPTYHADVLRVLSEAGNFAFMLVWHNTYAYRFTPFLTSPSRGYPSLPAHINNFVNSPQTVFAMGHGFYDMDSDIAIGAAHTTGWVVTPVAGSFITQGTTVAVSIRNVVYDIYIRLYTHGGKEIIKRAALNTQTGYYEAIFADEEIASVVGDAGGFEILAGGQVLGRSNMIFDEPYIMPYYMIDDFEGYFGNIALLNHTWTMGDVSDAYARVSLCSVNIPNIPGNRFSMRYEYTLFNVSAWLGVIRSIEGNFMDYDGISFWADGNGESVMIQLRYGGNGFEASVVVDGPGFYFVPFSAFVRAGWSASMAPLDLSNTIEGFQIFINAPSGSVFPLSGVMYFDHIRANFSFTLTYDLNGATGTTPAGRVTVEGAYFRTADVEGIIPPEDKVLKEWNTSPDGTGTSFAVSEYMIMPGQNITLYAIWVDTAEPPCCQDHPNCNCNYEPSVDFYDLQALVTQSLALNPNRYTASSWANLLAAKTAAQAVLANAEATQEQVDAAYTALQTAMAALVLAEVTLPPFQPPLPPHLPPVIPPPPVTVQPPPSITYIPWTPRTPYTPQQQEAVYSEVLTQEYEPTDNIVYAAYAEEYDETEMDDIAPTFINTLIFTVGSLEYTLNDTRRISVGAPFIDTATDRMMIPLRTLSEALGLEVDWDSATRSAIIFLPAGTLVIPVDEMLPDNMGTAIIVNDRAFIPLRFVMYAFEAAVEWDSANRAAHISW